MSEICWEYVALNIHNVRKFSARFGVLTAVLAICNMTPFIYTVKCDVNEPLSSLQAQRDAITKMSLQLSSTEYIENSHHSDPPPLKSSMRCDSVQDLEGECQEFWDWLLDMEATVQNSLGLLVSEEQHLQMCKRCSVELSLREDRVHSLYRQLATLRTEGATLSDCMADKEELIREKWDMLKFLDLSI
ncbi:A-kinase anchor protein 6-like [Eleutherodactylus coqui]|uniref:A-kinase anchor protein 6-like n=1 Tax=Eleutherodactylus coqui TaxID=57060 RepID=UPI00346355DE